MAGQENVGSIVYEVEVDTAQMITANQKASQALSGMAKSADSANKSFSSLDTQLTNTARSVNQASTASGKFRSSFQQAGYQIQDFIVQVQGGQSALVAFSQQGSQLAGAFGPGGAVVGALIALGTVLTGVLMSALGNASNQMDGLKKAAEDLNKIVVVNSQGVAALSNDYARLAATNATLAAQLRDNAISNYEIAVRDAGKAVQGIVKDQSSWFGSLSGGSASVSALGEVLSTLNITTDDFREAFQQASKTGLSTNSMASTLTATVSMLSGQLEVSDDAAFGLAKRMNELAKNPSAQAVSELVNYLNTLTPASRDGADEIAKLRTKFLEVASAIQTAQDNIDAAKKSLNDLKTAAQEANFDNLSKGLTQQLISYQKGKQAAVEYAISQQDLTEEQKKQAIELSRQVAAAEADSDAKKKLTEQSKQAALASQSVAERLEALRQKAELSAVSTGELSRQQAILQAQQSLGKAATQEQIQLAGEYAAKAYDTAAAIKEQASAEKRRQQVQKNYNEVQNSASPVQQVDSTYQKQMEDLNAYAALYPQKIEQVEAVRAAIEAKYREQRQAALWAEWSQQNVATQLFADTLQTSMNTVSSSITGVLNGTQDMNDALANIANTVLSSVVQSFVEMGVEWVKSAIMGQTAQTAAIATTTAASVAGTATTTAASTSSAAATTAAWTPAAIVASIGSFGGAAAIGIGAVVAAMALSSGLAGKRKNGGSVSAGGMYQVGESGLPEIYQASSGKQYMIPGDNGSVISNKDLQNGSSSGGVVINIQNYTSSTVDAQATDTGNGITVDVIVADLNQGGPISQAISTNHQAPRKARD